MPLLRGPINARPPAGAAPRSGGRRRKRAGLELLLRNPLFFLIFAVRVSQKFCRATEDMDVTLRRLAQNFYVVRRSLVPFCVVARRIRRRVGVDEQTKQIQDLYSMGLPLLDTRRIFSPPLWKLFNSYSRKELPQKEWPVW